VWACEWLSDENDPCDEDRVVMVCAGVTLAPPPREAVTLSLLVWA
jgi:hypothetical protein